MKNMLDYFTIYISLKLLAWGILTFLKKANPNGDYAAVIPKWINNVKNNRKIIIYGDGNTSRDFCPVANVVQANILAGIKSLKKNSYI